MNSYSILYECLPDSVELLEQQLVSKQLGARSELSKRAFPTAPPKIVKTSMQLEDMPMRAEGPALRRNFIQTTVGVALVGSRPFALIILLVASAMACSTPGCYSTLNNSAFQGACAAIASVFLEVRTVSSTWAAAPCAPRKWRGSALY